MIRSTCEVKFRVAAETVAGDVVYVVGGTSELGNWLPHRAKPLSMERVLHSNRQVWSSTLQLSLGEPVIEYRYFIGHLEESEGDGEEKQAMVRVWETNIKPRSLNLLNPKPDEIEDPATFGIYGGSKCIDKGWLSGQTEIHLRLHTNPLNLWRPRHRVGQFRVKCNSIDLRYNDVHATEDEDSIHDLPSAALCNRVLVSVLNGTQNKPTEQDQFGTVFLDNDYMVFRAQTFTPEYLGFQFDFYLETHSGSKTSQDGLQSNGHRAVPEFIGSAYILPVNLKHNAGSRVTPIVGTKHKPIGELRVEHLIIKPMKNISCDMKTSFAKHWKSKRRALDVGHRGMGNSYTGKECAFIPENTIESLVQAASHGADFVEFDVQLSKDNIPVVYHDFNVSLSLRKRNQEELEWFDIPVQDLKWSQLQMLKLDHVSEKSKGDPSTATNNGPEDRRHFPTLRQCLDKLDPHVGFNIEIKYCMQVKSGVLEEGLRHFMERNEYVDIILQDLLPFAGDRRIVFSSFDPDVCSMLRLKQNRYPVFFLTIGNTTLWEKYMDPRCDCTVKAMNFGESESFCGINPHTEDLLREPDLITQAKNMGLIVFCWGDDNNDTDTIAMLKKQGVDGVIYDRIYELKHNKENVFKMEHEAKLKLLCNMGALSVDTAADTYSSSPEHDPNSPDYNGGVH